MSVGTELQGPRLEFVVRELPGTVTRNRAIPPMKDGDGKVEMERRVEPAGFMVFTPFGACYRVTDKELLKRGLDRQPSIINFEAANDTKSAAGRFKLARNDNDRKKAWAEMEQEVIRTCMRHGGSVEHMLSDYDPKGKLNVPSAA